MASRESLKRALIEAHKKGDTKAASLFADMLKAMPEQSGVQPTVGGSNKTAANWSRTEEGPMMYQPSSGGMERAPTPSAGKRMEKEGWERAVSPFQAGVVSALNTATLNAGMRLSPEWKAYSSEAEKSSPAATGIGGLVGGALLGRVAPGGPTTSVAEASWPQIVKTGAKLTAQQAGIAGVSAANAAEPGNRLRAAGEAAASTAAMGLPITTALAPITMRTPRGTAATIDNTPELGFQNPTSWTNPESYLNEAARMRNSSLRATPSEFADVVTDYAHGSANPRQAAINFGREVNAARTGAGRPVFGPVDAGGLVEAAAKEKQGAGAVIGAMESAAEEAGNLPSIPRVMRRAVDRAMAPGGVGHSKDGGAARMSAFEQALTGVADTASPRPTVGLVSSGNSGWYSNRPASPASVPVQAVRGEAPAIGNVSSGTNWYGNRPPPPAAPTVTPVLGPRPVLGYVTSGDDGWYRNRGQPAPPSAPSVKTVQGDAPVLGYVSSGSPGPGVTAPQKPTVTTLKGDAPVLGYVSSGPAPGAVTELPKPSVTRLAGERTPLSSMADAKTFVTEARNSAKKRSGYYAAPTDPDSVLVGQELGRASSAMNEEISAQVGKTAGREGAAAYEGAKDRYGLMSRVEDLARPNRSDVAAPFSLSSVIEGGALATAAAAAGASPGVVITARQGGRILGRQGNVAPTRAYRYARIGEAIDNPAAPGLDVSHRVAGTALRGAQSAPATVGNALAVSSGADVAHSLDDPNYDPSALSMRAKAAKAARQWLESFFNSPAKE